MSLLAQLAWVRVGKLASGGVPQLLPWLQGYCLQQSEFVFGAAVGACAKGQASS